MNTLVYDTSCKLLNEKELLSKKTTSFTAIISGASEVFCLFPGEVEFVGTFNGMQSIDILINGHELIRYLNLDHADCRKGMVLTHGEYCGKVNKKRGLGFEYCTQWQGQSKYPVRLCGRTFYKQNPIDILNGIYEPPQEIGITYAYTSHKTDAEFEDYQMDEWRPGDYNYRMEVQDADEDIEKHIEASLFAKKSG